MFALYNATSSWSAQDLRKIKAPSTDHTLFLRSEVLSIPAYFRGVPPSHLAPNCPECFNPKQNVFPSRWVKRAFPCQCISPLWCNVATCISAAWLFCLPSYRATLPSGLKNGSCPKIASSKGNRPRVFMFLAGKEELM